MLSLLDIYSQRVAIMTS